METRTLRSKNCTPCEGQTSPLTADEINALRQDIDCSWKVSSDAKSISREFILRNFLAGIRFIQDIAAVAEKENHHPDIHLTGYRKLNIVLATHAIGGLSENDFILAAKIDALPVELRGA